MYECGFPLTSPENEDFLSQIDSTATTDLLACPERTFPLKVLLSECGPTYSIQEGCFGVLTIFRGVSSSPGLGASKTCTVLSSKTSTVLSRKVLSWLPW